MNYIDLPSGYKFKNAYGERILPKSFKVFEAGQYVLEKKLALRMSQSELMNALYQWIYLPLQLTYLEIETATIPKSTTCRKAFGPMRCWAYWDYGFWRIALGSHFAFTETGLINCLLPEKWRLRPRLS